MPPLHLRIQSFMYTDFFFEVDLVQGVYPSSLTKLSMPAGGGALFISSLFSERPPVEDRKNKNNTSCIHLILVFTLH